MRLFSGDVERGALAKSLGTTGISGQHDGDLTHQLEH